MRQQRTEEPARGGLPDVWELIPNRPILDVDINPETIAKPAFYAFEGRSPDLQTAVVEVGEEPVRITALADIQDAMWTEGRLTFRVPYFEGATTHVLVTGLTMRPRNVSVDGVLLPPVAMYEPTEQAWTYRAGIGGGDLVIKLRHTEASEVVVEF